jgi:hypothetical protein
LPCHLRAPRLTVAQNSHGRATINPNRGLKIAFCQPLNWDDHAPVIGHLSVWLVKAGLVSSLSATTFDDCLSLEATLIWRRGQ